MAVEKRNGWVSAQALAKVAAQPYNTIDYWAERKLLLCERIGRKRLFHEKRNLRRIRFIRALQKRGYSLEPILDAIKRKKL